MAEEEVGLRLSLKDRIAAVKGLKEVRDGVARVGREAGKAGRTAATVGAKGFDRMVGGVRALSGVAGRGLVAGLAAGGAAVAGFAYWVGQGSRSLMRIQKIGAQTNAVIKSTGGVANVSRAQIDGLAGRLEGLTGVEAESITEGQNLLLTFTNIRNGAGKNNKIFNQATRTLTDMSVALGKDASGSAVQLGKALNDPIKGVTALQKIGVSFTQDQKDQIKALVESGKTMKAQKLILAELNKEFGGSAEAYGQTDAGKIERFQHAVGTLQETIATAFAPTLGRLADTLLNKGVPAADALGRSFEAGVEPKIRKAIRTTRDLWKLYRQDGISGVVGRVEELTGTQGRLNPILDKGRAIARDVADIFMNSVVPALASGSSILPAVLTPAQLLVNVLGYLADHGELTKNVIIGLVAAMTLAKVASLGFAAAEKLSLFWLKAHTAGTKTHLVVSAAARAATMAWTAAQWLLNAAFLASPIGWIVLGLAALVAGFVIAYKKSETFRNIVNGALSAVGNAARAVFGWVRSNWPLLVAILTGPFGIAVYAIVKNWDRIKHGAGSAKDFVVQKFNALVGFFTRLPSRMTTAASGLFNGIKDAFRGAINWVIDKWNALSFDLPSVDIPGIGKVGGGGLSTPDIERLARGGRVRAGEPYIVGDRGPRHAWELFVPDQPGRVLPRVQQPAMPSLAAGDLDLDDAELTAGPAWPGGPITINLVVDRQVLGSVVLDDLRSRTARL